ncbi:MAG: phosphoribosylformylglycinamidine synthase II, partial [Myxococcota bacterium]
MVRVEVACRAGQADARGVHLACQARALGLAVETIRVSDLYFLGFSDDSSPAAREKDAAGVAQELLIDPVTQEPGSGGEARGRVIEVSFLPGVTDNQATSLLDAARRLGHSSVTAAATGHRYDVSGTLDDAQLTRLASGLLANEVVQQWSLDSELEAPFVLAAAEADLSIGTVALRDASETELVAISTERRLSLDAIEMLEIQKHFRLVGRDPSDAELEMLAQTWSEHCVHKTFRALITCEDDGEHYVVDSMYQTYIKQVTQTLDPPWLRSVFVDNAGIVAFDDHFDLAFKVETHNHPSALEPFGGSNTGVGGVVRDVIGVSARPIATTDVLCFGPQDLDPKTLPDGVLHPQRIAQGVIDGVGDYGNKMGIPTVNGAVLYHPGYTANPLVFVGCLGLLPSGSHPRAPQVGDLVVTMGGKTGRDGLRGATFSSMAMGVETAEVAGLSVQIGNPIVEKMVLDVCMEARDERLYTAITDCGAGGLSSAVGEMGAELGVDVQIENVPLKYPGLAPWEIWLSEAQERMVLAVPPENEARLQELCEARGVEAVVLGRFTGDARIVVRFGEIVVADLDCEFLHDGIPQRRLTARWERPEDGNVPAELPTDGLALDVLALLASPNIRSKESVVRTFDHEVQGGTVVKPFVGPKNDGPGDAAVLWPREVMERALKSGSDEARGVALSVGVNPAYGARDPYRMAWAAVDEAVRNAVCVGADPGQVALLDNFCWGDPKLPDRLGSLVRCARGCHDAAMAFRAPFISGKDSLNNEYSDENGVRQAIPGTILISAMAIVPDLDRTVTMDLKSAGNHLIVLGNRATSLGGSAWLEHRGFEGGEAPAPEPEAPNWYAQLHAAMQSGLVASCHDCSDGGLAVAAAEMALASGLGLTLDLDALGSIQTAEKLFAEANGRLLIEVSADSLADFEAAMFDAPVVRLGRVTDTGLVVNEHGAPMIELSNDELTA